MQEKKKAVVGKKKITVAKKKVTQTKKFELHVARTGVWHPQHADFKFMHLPQEKKGTCSIPICSLCIEEHKRGCRAVDNHKLLCRLTTFLCQKHFNAEATNIHLNNDMSVVQYETEVPFYNELETEPTTSTKVTNEPNVPSYEEEYTYAESDDWKRLSKYDLMSNKTVDYATIFEKLFASDDNGVMIPQVLPNVSQGDATRTCRRNKIFLRNFIGLCIWKNMNGDGSPMVKKNTFNPDKSPDNVRDFRRHVTILEENHTFTHWANMQKLDITDVNANVLFNHCNNLKNTIKSGPTFNRMSDNTAGIYDRFVEILYEIDFPVVNR